MNFDLSPEMVIALGTATGAVLAGLRRVFTEVQKGNEETSRVHVIVNSRYEALLAERNQLLLEVASLKLIIGGRRSYDPVVPVPIPPREE